MRSLIPAEVKARFRLPARIVAMVGAALMVASIYLSWSYGHDVLDDVGYYGAPSPLQLFFGLLALVTLALLAVPLLGKERLGRWAKVLAWNSTAKTAAIWSLAMAAVMVAAIAIALGGLVNVDPGGWLALIGGGLAVVATRFLPDSPEPTLYLVKSPQWLTTARERGYRAPATLVPDLLDAARAPSRLRPEPVTLTAPIGHWPVPALQLL